MKLVAPDYCLQFKCKAGECRHSCCIGWEIDIDSTSLDRFLTEEGPLGEKLKNKIDVTADGASFTLEADERCPFLQADSLCELICKKGEGYICDICTEHPRFYNEYETRTEMGLGMSCEAAAELILASPFNLVTLEQGDEDNKDFEERDHVLEVLTDRSLNLEQKFLQICEEYYSGYETDAGYWAGVLLNLERLDPAWDEYINLLSGQNELISPENSRFSAEFERIALYFVYRWVSDFDCGGTLRYYNFEETLAFALVSTNIIATIFEAGEQTSERLAEICRLYSSEIEYSDINPQEIVEAILMP